VESGAPTANVRVLSQAVEFGKGHNTVLARIAAEALNSVMKRRNSANGHDGSFEQRPDGGFRARRCVVRKLVQSAAEGIKANDHKSGEIIGTILL